MNIGTKCLNNLVVTKKTKKASLDKSRAIDNNYQACDKIFGISWVFDPRTDTLDCHDIYLSSN